MSIDGGDKGSWSAEHLPPGWGWVSFNEFWTDHTDSKRKIPQNLYLAEGTFPVIDQGATLIGGYANDGTKKSLAPLPVIIFGDHTRAIKYFDRPFIQGADGVRVLCAAQRVDPLFAYHALRCVQLPDKGYSRHFRFLKATQFPLAPLPEQHRIVAKIDSLTAKSQRARDHLDHIPRLVERYKQAILAAAFRGELTLGWRSGRNISISVEQLEALRNKAWKSEHEQGRVSGRYNTAESIDWQPTIEVPKGWTWASVDQVAFLIQYGSSAKTNEDKSGVAVLRMGNIRDGTLDLTSLKFLPEDHEEFPALLLENGGAKPETG